MKMGLTQSVVDPCMFFCFDEDKKVIELMVILYVDDTILSGKKEFVNEFKKEFGAFFTVKHMGKLRMHLGVKYEWTKENNETVLVASMKDMAMNIINH